MISESGHKHYFLEYLDITNIVTAAVVIYTVGVKSHQAVLHSKQRIFSDIFATNKGLNRVPKSVLCNIKWLMKEFFNETVEKSPPMTFS